MWGIHLIRGPTSDYLDRRKPLQSEKVRLDPPTLLLSRGPNGNRISRQDPEKGVCDRNGHLRPVNYWTSFLQYDFPHLGPVPCTSQIAREHPNWTPDPHCRNRHACSAHQGTEVPTDICYRGPRERDGSCHQVCYTPDGSISTDRTGTHKVGHLNHPMRRSSTPRDSRLSKNSEKASCGERVVQKGVLESPFLLCTLKVCS